MEQDSDLYEKDFHAWTQHTAALLRSGRFDEVDIAHAADEIDDMGKRDLKELNSRMQILLMHLLKWQYQPSKRSPSWLSTIVSQRIEIDALLRQSPSLRPKLLAELADNYVGAVKRAVPETGFGKDRFPPRCPFTVEQVLDEQFLPEAKVRPKARRTRERS
jgi:hypothetical protein